MHAKSGAREPPALGLVRGRQLIRIRVLPFRDARACCRLRRVRGSSKRVESGRPAAWDPHADGRRWAIPSSVQMGSRARSQHLASIMLSKRSRQLLNHPRVQKLLNHAYNNKLNQPCPYLSVDRHREACTASAMVQTR